MNITGDDQQMNQYGTFGCEMCGGTFPKAWSDEESAAETLSVFSSDELVDGALVCDQCWQQMRSADADLDARYRRAGL